MSESRSEHLSKCLEKMTKLLDQHMDLVNTCMVDFIVNDMFNIIPNHIQIELLNLTDKQLGIIRSPDEMQFPNF